MKAIIAGGRDYRLTKSDRSALDLIVQAHGVTEVVYGDYRGTDRDAGRWAKARGLKVTPMPADWDAFGAAAGPMRNQAMVDYVGHGLLVAFPGEKGTADVTRRARRAGLTILEFSAEPTT